MQAEDAVLPMLGASTHLQDLQGRVAILTGGVCGTGCEVARALVLQKCRVILVNAMGAECNKTISNIRKEVGTGVAIEWRYCDLTDLIQVRDIFSSLVEELPRLDLCIFSTGIDASCFKADINCIDAYFGMMWLGHFYACNILWPLLRGTSRLPNTPAPRVIFEAPEQQQKRSGMGHEYADACLTYEAEIYSEIYERSRTTLILGVRHGLADRIIKRHGDNIYALSVQPSASAKTVKMETRRDSFTEATDLCDKLLDELEREKSIPLRSCSRSVLYAASSPDVEQNYLNGAYLIDMGSLGEEDDLAADPSLGPGVWDISERAIKAVVGKGALMPWDGGLY